MYFVSLQYKYDPESGVTTTRLGWGYIHPNNINKTYATHLPIGYPFNLTLKHPEIQEKDGFWGGEMIFPVEKASVEALRNFVDKSALNRPAGSEHTRNAPYYHRHGDGIKEKFESPQRTPVHGDGRKKHDHRIHYAKNDGAYDIA